MFCFTFLLTAIEHHLYHPIADFMVCVCVVHVLGREPLPFYGTPYHIRRVLSSTFVCWYGFEMRSYPAGFVYVFSLLRQCTGGDVVAGQVLTLHLQIEMEPQKARPTQINPFLSFFCFQATFIFRLTTQYQQ